MVLTPYGIDILRSEATSGETVMLYLYAGLPSTTQGYTPSVNLEPMHLNLDCGRKLEYPKRPHKDKWRALQFHRGRP